jgi:hypothetical protein
MPTPAPGRGREVVSATRPADGKPNTAAFALASCESSGIALTSLRTVGGQVQATGVSRYADGTPVVVREEGGAAMAKTTVARDGTFAVTFPQGQLTRKDALARLYAVSAVVRSRALRLVRGNSLDVVKVDGRVITITGTLAAPYRSSKVAFSALGGRRLAGCDASQHLRSAGGTKYDPKTGRYTLRVIAPKGSGYVMVRVKARSTEGTAFSVFAVR